MERQPLASPTRLEHAEIIDLPPIIAEHIPELPEVPPPSPTTRRWVWRVVFAISLALLLFVHLWRLDAVPRGLYVDESSIGLNAATIVETLQDEHGHILPLYFQAFGEYKNPLYIYTAAVMFAIFGISIWSLHATSFIWLAAFVFGLGALAWRVFPGNRVILWFALVAGSMLPWIFPLSRISFELIAQPACLIWALYFIYRGYQGHQIKRWWLYPALAGLAIGLSVYAYSTGRLLAFVLVGTVLVVYFRRKYWHRHAALLAAGAATLLPYLIYSIRHPGALTSRFNLISFIDDSNLTLVDKLGKLIINYFSYFSPMFLLTAGDPNPRHHIGLNGQLFISVIILTIGGLIWLLRRWPPTGPRLFGWVLLLNLLAAPVAAAVTEPYHGLRSLSMAVYILVLALFGLGLLQKIKLPKLRTAAVGLVLGLLVLESANYAYFYFTAYPKETESAFESYDFGRALQQAVDHQPNQIIVTSRANMPYAHLEFYQRMVQNPRLIPMEVADPVAAPSTCILYFAFDPTVVNEANLPVTFANEVDYTRVKCFE